MRNLQEMYEEFTTLYHNIKHEVRHTDAHLYERWKAGGFLVDDNIVSMYPNLDEVVESLLGEEEVEEDEIEE